MVHFNAAFNVARVQVPHYQVVTKVKHAETLCLIPLTADCHIILLVWQKFAVNKNHVIDVHFFVEHLCCQVLSFSFFSPYNVSVCYSLNLCWLLHHSKVGNRSDITKTCHCDMGVQIIFLYSLYVKQAIYTQNNMLPNLSFMFVVQKL